MADIKDDSVDWIYIDGNHSYEFVKEDLNAGGQSLRVEVICVAMIISKENTKLKNCNSGLCRLLMSSGKSANLKLIIRN